MGDRTGQRQQAEPIYSYVYIYICIYIHIYMYIYTARGSCNKPSLYIAMCVYIYVQYICIHIYMYISNRTGRRRQAEPEGSTTEKPLGRSSRTLSCALERVGRKLEAPKSVVPPYGAHTRTHARAPHTLARTQMHTRTHTDTRPHTDTHMSPHTHTRTPAHTRTRARTRPNGSGFALAAGLNGLTPATAAPRTGLTPATSSPSGPGPFAPPHRGQTD